MLDTRVLWSASLGAADFDARLAAAAAHRFNGLTVSPGDVAQLGDGLGDARRRAADLGVDTLIVEAYTEWYPHDPSPVPFPATQWSLDSFRSAAAAFGSTDVCLVAPFKSTATVATLTELFGGVCDALAADGITVHLEFSPFPPIGSLAKAWEIVRGAGCRNGGITVDSWHFFRGRPDLDLVATIPGASITSVQLSDGGDGLVEGLVKDTFRHRMLPGDGVFDLAGLVATLRRIGGWRMAGPEVLSVDFAGCTAGEIACRCGSAFDRAVGD